MRVFYVVAALAAICLALAPFYLIPATDVSMVTQDTPDPTPPGAATRPDSRPTLHETAAIYDSYSAKIRSRDPATCGDTSSAGIQGNVFESLYAYHFLKRPPQDSIVPQLAAALPTISADGMTYTIPLKKGVLFHRNQCFGVQTDANGKKLYESDGKTPLYKTREVTADDFVLAFKRIADYHLPNELSIAFIQDRIAGISDYQARTQAYPAGDFSRYAKESISGIKALDSHTLQIKLTTPFPQLLYVLAIANYAPIPHEVIDYWLSKPPLEKRSAEIHDFRAMVGTGAYYIRDFVDGGRIVLCRNPDYRPEYYPGEGDKGDKEAGLLEDAGKRVPLADVLYMEYVPESNPAWMMFLTKQTDVAGIPPDVYTQVITPSKELSGKMAAQGIKLLKYTYPAVYWMTFNMEDPVVGKSKSLRQALNLAFDVQQFIDVRRNGRGKPAINIVPTGFDGRDEAGPGPYNHYDKAAALRKIEDAKKELVAAKVISPGDGIPPLTLSLGGQDEETRRYAEYVQAQFKEIGVTIIPELVDWPTLLRKMARKQCQIYSSGWHADYPDSENFLQLFYTPNIKRGTNNSNYSDAEYDRLYEQASKMLPSKERTAIYVKMIRKLSEDCPFVLESEPVTFVLHHAWIYNFKPHPIGYGFAKYRRIDLDKRRAEGGR